MDRNREARRIPMAAPGNGMPRRRHRAGSFRDSPEDEGPVELPEATRLRDRGRDRDKERNRLKSRSKRRRGERLIMVHGNLDDGGDDSSEGSVNDDEEYDDGGDVKSHSSLKMLPPARNPFLPHRKTVFRSSPWKAVDEMIGVSVPRKARSACTKRPHESWASNTSGGGVFTSGEKIHRQVSTSPARVSPASILASPSSPSSSTVSVRKTKQKSLPPKSSSCKLSSPVAAQDEIEIEIAEVLYGMMRMPLTSSKQESTDLPISKSSITLDTTNSSSFNVSAIAPKRKKPRNIKDDETNSNLPSGVSTISSNINSEAEAPLKSEVLRSRSVDENSFLDSRSAEKKESHLTKDEAVMPEKEKFLIDLMAPPPAVSSSERGDEMECVAAEAKPKVTEMETETEAMPQLKHDESEANTKPRTVAEAEPHGSKRNCGVEFDLMQPPQHLLFNQPRPKRCATHCYIARNIQSHQQVTKMNPFWPSAAGSASLYGTKACNLSLMPHAEQQGSVLSRSSNLVAEKNSQSTNKSSDTSQRNQICLQQAFPPGATNNIMHGSTFIFPVGQQPNATATIAASSVRPPNSGPTSSSGAIATPAGAQTMSFGYPGIPGNETQYLAILQNNGYQFPVPALVGEPTVYRGAPGQPIPFFNGSFYSSQMIQPQHLQPQKQQQSSQMLQSHASNNQNRSVATGSLGAQKPLQSEKKSQQQQQVSKSGVEPFHSKGYGITFETFNGANSSVQSHAMFHSIPEAARQGYHMIGTQQKMNYSTPPEDVKSKSTAANTMEEQRKTRGEATEKTSGSIVDSSSRFLNLDSNLVPTSHNQQHMQRNQSHQPYTMYLQKQQQYATSAAASAARTQGSIPSNASGYPDHKNTASPAGTTKFLNANSGFPQNLVQSGTGKVQSPQWKNNSGRTTNTSQDQSPSMLSPSSSSLRNASHKQQSRPQQSQISFAANSKPMASSSQGGTNNQSLSPPIIGSPSTSSISKNTSGSPKTTATATASSGVNKASYTIHSSSQPSKKLQSASVTSSASGRNSGPSALGKSTTSSGSKSQQQQQDQLYFSNPYMQPQHHNQNQQQQITMYPNGGFYIQRHQQQSGSATSDPAKAIAAATAANKVKGGSGGGMGETQQHQLVPPAFPYVHEVKTVDQKQRVSD